MKLYAFIALLLLSTASSIVSAQGFGFGIGAGAAQVDTSSGNGKSSPTFQFSGNYSVGFQDTDSGFNFFTGFLWQRTNGADVIGYGKTKFNEIQYPLGFGFRTGRLSLFMYADIRSINISTHTGQDSSHGDISTLGGGLRFPFGEAGTTAGRFAFRGLFSKGAGSFKDPLTLDVKENVTVKDARAALEYAISGHSLLRVEYRRAIYSGDGNSPLFDQKFNSLMAIYGYSF